MIYEDEKTSGALQEVVTKYLTLWESSDTVIDLSEELDLKVPLVTDWKAVGAKLAHWTYPQDVSSQALIDEKFNKLQSKGKLKYISRPTPFSFPVFVVWITTFEGLDKILKKKGHVMVDIQGLNKIVITDNYPMLSQEDIISAVQSCLYLTIINCSSQFFQFWVVKKDWHKFTVTSHWGQEEFQVAVMSFKNSPSHTQRTMNDIIRGFWHFACCYVDDIVIFSKTLEEHVSHLTDVFKLFKEKWIALESKKFFIEYLSVTLLEHQVNDFGLATATKKIAAIHSLKFLKTLTELEYYLDLSTWLRHKVPYFTIVADSLKKWKTMLLKGSPLTWGAARSNFTSQAKWAPTPEELKSFEVLQSILSDLSFLIHINQVQELYIDLDTSKKGIGVHVYHVKGNLNLDSNQWKDDFTRTNMELVMFLSKKLTNAEKKYWPTELEVVRLVWTLRKVKHVLDSTMKATIVYTNHFTTTSIMKQTLLFSSSINKLNLCLVHASQYISQFNLNIWWKSGWKNMVPDALSQLLNQLNEKIEQESEGVLDEIFTYHYIIVEMTNEYKKELKEAYSQDQQWERITDLLKVSVKQQSENSDFDSDNSKINLEVKEVQFIQQNGLLYYVKNDDYQERLCISKALKKPIFKQAHDLHSHAGFHQAYSWILKSIYMRKLEKWLQRYIVHCSECQLNQTKWHLPNESLELIKTFRISFHTIIIDFILTLPLSKEGYNCALSVICKFSKWVTILTEKDMYSVTQWVNILLLSLADWEISAAMISDCDSKFLFNMWKTIFESLSTKLLMSTAYHSQSDEQSEQSNQTIKIAL